ncbi:MAG: putative membrane protein [Candidatus Azotimanducaceae bacterium]
MRVVAIAASFEGLLAEAFDQIRSSAEANVAILARMLSALDTIGSLTIRLSHLRALDEQLQWIVELADRCIESSHDHARLERKVSEVRETLAAQSAVCVVVEKG